MFKGLKLLAALSLLAAGIGCHSDKPHDYGRERPPVDQLDSRDKGLQSKDVISASEAMAQSILADIPELNASPTRWTIVVDRVENISSDRRQDFDIFLERVRVRLAQLGRGRVQLVENRDKLRALQSRELEPGAQDEFGQGGGGRPAPGPAGIQPDFSLYARLMEMPNRATSYFMVEFTISALRDTPQHRAREQVWSNMYEVKVAR